MVHLHCALETGCLQLQKRSDHMDYDNLEHIWYDIHIVVMCTIYVTLY